MCIPYMGIPEPGVPDRCIPREKVAIVVENYMEILFEGISEQGLKIKGVFRDVVRYGATKARWLSSQTE